MAISLVKRVEVGEDDVMVRCKYRFCKHETPVTTHAEDCNKDPRYCAACLYVDMRDNGAFDPYEGYEDDRDDIDGYYFADPGGRSALRATRVNWWYNQQTEEMEFFCPEHNCHTKVDEDDSFCRGCGYHLNPRKLPCPTCDCPGMITEEDKQRGYQCDHCADAAEGISMRGCTVMGY